MYVYRQTIHVKTGCLQELVALQSEFWKRTSATLYLPQTGLLEVFEVQWEFESYAAMEEVGAAFVEMRKTFPKPEQLQKQDELIVSITGQIW